MRGDVRVDALGLGGELAGAHGLPRGFERRRSKVVRCKVACIWVVEPSKVTLIGWLRTWLDKSVKPPTRRPETYRVYTSLVEQHVAPDAGPEQPLRAARHPPPRPEKGGEGPAALGEPGDRSRTPPTVNRPQRGGTCHCRTATEARRFIDAAKAESPQTAAFCFLALDTGARKSELAALTWADIDLDAATLTVNKQLDRGSDEQPVFDMTKTGRTRTITLGAETIARLRDHSGHKLNCE